MAKKKMQHEAPVGGVPDLPQADAPGSDTVLEGGPGQQADRPERTGSSASQPQRADEPAPAANELSADGPTGTADPLMHEVQTFFTQRDALARKLAAEIEATERKLEELKQTAARLFPQSEESSVRERKARKTKTKASSRPPRSESSGIGEDRIPGGGG